MRRTKLSQLQLKEKVEGLLSNPVILIRTLGLSLYEFVQMFWNEVSDDEFRDNWHIPYICKELEIMAERVAEGKPKLYDLIINIPPGTTKTIVCSIMFPAWCWTRWHWMRFITGSHSETLSLESAEKSRDVIQSQKFREVYPELGLKEDKNVKSNFRVYKREQVYPGHVARIHYGGNRFSTSVGSKIFGFHGHIIIIDDPLDPSSEAGEAAIKAANYWINQKLSTRKVDKKITPMIIVMQRLHQNDPTGMLLKNTKLKIKHICLPGEIENYKNKVSPPELVERYKDGLLDPVRLDWDSLLELEARLGQYGYAGQIGQDPTPPGGGMFKVDHFRMVENPPPPVDYVRSVRYWDKAATEGRGAFTTGVKMSLLAHGKYIVEDVVRGQWSTEDREDIIREVAEADGYDVAIFVEQEPGSGGKESAEATVRNLSGYACYADPPQGSKAFRADSFSVQVNYGNVLLLKGEWNYEYIEEHRFFPHGTYKDQVDASSGAFRILTGKREARVLKRE